MKIARSFRYKGIPVTITISQVTERGTIQFLNSSKTIKTMDMNILIQEAESLIDKELNGSIYNNCA